MKPVTDDTIKLNDKLKDLVEISLTDITVASYPSFRFKVHKLVRVKTTLEKACNLPTPKLTFPPGLEEDTDVR